MNFELSILGTGSAIPSFGRFSSAQVLHTHNKSFLIDCADGTQFQLRKYGIKTNRMNHWFISHLHGDHCYGIISVLSTLAMLHHTGDIHIHAHPDLEPILKAQLDYFCKDLSFQVHFEPLNPLRSEVIYEDRSIKVSTIPLVHSMPTCGFLFKEKEGLPHIDGELVKFYKIGVKEIQNIKNGADFIDENGRLVPNSRLITPPTPPKSYAYCSDTAYTERIIPIIEGAMNYLCSRSSKKVIYDINLPKEEEIILPINQCLLEWVLENLSKNAIDAMGGIGTLSLEMSQDNKRVIIDISDTGKGMQKKEFKKIFEAGYTTKERGGGMGLSLAKRIIEEYHHGKIFVKQSVIGKGTTFRIMLKKL